MKNENKWMNQFKKKLDLLIPVQKKKVSVTWQLCYFCLYITLSLFAKLQKKVTNRFSDILKNVNFKAKIDRLITFPGQKEFS